MDSLTPGLYGLAPFPWAIVGWKYTFVFVDMSRHRKGIMAFLSRRGFQLRGQLTELLLWRWLNYLSANGGGGDRWRRLQSGDAEGGPQLQGLPGQLGRLCLNLFFFLNFF